MRLNESPDVVEFEDGSELWCNDDKSYAFGYAIKSGKEFKYIGTVEGTAEFGKNTELLVSGEKEIHRDIKHRYSIDYTHRDNLLFPGRIWLDEYIISFWDYPKSQREKRQVIEDLENYFNIKIIGNSEWVVEIEDKEFETATSYTTNKDIDYAKWKRTQHVKAGRFGRKVPDGIGSESKKYGKISTTQAHQMMRTSEELKLRNIIRKIIIKE